MTATTTRKRQPRPTVVLGLWQPDRTAPILLDGEVIGKLCQGWGWYDIEFSTGLVWPGAKKISRALDTAAFIYATRPAARPGGDVHDHRFLRSTDEDPRTPQQRERDAAADDWAAQVSDLRASM
jgi:hypothetical protein